MTLTARLGPARICSPFDFCLFALRNNRCNFRAFWPAPRYHHARARFVATRGRLRAWWDLMNPLVKQLRAPTTNSPSVRMAMPVVRIQARFGNTWAAWGSGFVIRQWPSSIITARHVVALPQGIAPGDVRVEAFLDGIWSRFEVTTIAFPSGGTAIPDVAIVRIHGTCTSTLEAATMDEPSRVQIWGYPLAVGRPSASPLVVGCRAQPVNGTLKLERSGRPGMSGGPVVAISNTGSPLAAVGIYLGTSPNGAKANLLIDDALFASKDAAMSACESPSGTSS